MNIKLMLLAFFGGIAALIGAFIKGGQAARDKIIAKSEKHARKVENKAHKEMIAGLKKEQEVRDEKADPDSNHFTRQ